MVPRRSPRPCAKPGCPNLAWPPERYCKEHKREVQRQMDAERGSAAARGYGHRWRRLRAMVLAEHPL